MDPTLTLNEDFFVEDYDHSPAVEVVDSGYSAPPGACHDLPFTTGESAALAHYERTSPRSTNPWDPRLILDLAVGVDSMQDILLRYGLTPIEFEYLSQSQVFRRELALAIKDVRDNGVSFTQKARIQAEGYLDNLDQLVQDASTPASTKLEAIRSTVKWGRLEPKEEKNDGPGAGQAINIQINF